MNKINKEIKDIIESYCEGITWLEFAESDLDEMVEKIVKVKVELNSLLKPDVIVRSEQLQ